jgi:hypothetical protein
VRLGFDLDNTLLHRKWVARHREWGLQCILGHIALQRKVLGSQMLRCNIVWVLLVFLVQRLFVRVREEKKQ